MRWAVVAALLLVLAGLTLTLVGTISGPLSRSCAASLDATACDGAVGAVLRRGMPVPHPLILGARVEPGSEPAANQFGHRATVTFDLLGMPGPASIALYYDSGAHWGGVPDRAAEEIRAWSVAPLALSLVLAAALLGVSWWRRSRASADGARSPTG